jgi:formate hydrogenlyase subunit 3/multisubunit Na+/H+ antiporter MnhD subunit
MATGVALLVISLRWPLDRVVLVGGRMVLFSRPLAGLGYILTVTEAERPVLAALGLVALAAFAGMTLQSPGRPFVPVGLLIVVLWVAAVTVRRPTGALAAMVTAGCLSVFVVQNEWSVSTRAAFRQMWWPLVAFPLAMIAAWHAQEATWRPGEVAHLQAAARLMGLALLVLLAPVPLHAPAVSLLAQAPPVVGAFLLVGAQAVLLHLTWTIFAGWPWLAEHVEVSRALALGGWATLLWGAMGAASAERVRHLWAYAALHDWGVWLLGFSLGAPLEWRMATALFVGRALSLFLSAYGIANLRSHVRQPVLADSPGDDWTAVRGQARRLPWTVLSIMVGGLGLAGFPLTASFGPRWALTQTLLGTEPTWGLLIVIGQLGVVLGYLRLLQVLLAPLPVAQRLVPRERFATIILLAVGVALSGVLALVPQAMDGIVQTVIGIVVQAPSQGL